MQNGGPQATNFLSVTINIYKQLRIQLFMHCLHIIYLNLFGPAVSGFLIDQTTIARHRYLV